MTALRKTATSFAEGKRNGQKDFFFSSRLKLPPASS